MIALLVALADIDASYGRFDGDVAVAAAAGVTVGPRAPRVSGDLRLRYLSTVGIFGTIEQNGASAPRRAIAVGAEVRPLFLVRWAKGKELTSPRLDLLIDSFALELGAAFVPGPALQAGLGIEVPFFPSATGPFLGLHAGARWSDAALAGNARGGPGDRAVYLSISLGFQQVLRAHLVAAQERP